MSYRTVAIFLAILMTTAGCVSHVRVGMRPDVERLESQLRLGQSIQDDVRQALGEPFGRGRANMPMDPATKQAGPMWLYYYEDTDLDRRDSRALMLFVYFDGDRYVGYLWFSSLPK